MTKQTLNKFLRAQVSSLASTIVDFGVTIFLKELCGVWYLFSTSVGSILGGMTNFSIGRQWVFNATGRSMGTQAVRYLLVWGGSIFLNIGGMWLLTSIGNINYLYSKIFTTVFVGIFFNYLLQYTYVFKFNHESRKTASV
jgi:putative flippase GtrA